MSVSYYLSSSPMIFLVRMYEHVRDLGLFLFNDALVLSERKVSHQPYSHALRISHTFLASVALHSLVLEDIADTKCKCRRLLLYIYSVC